MFRNNDEQLYLDMLVELHGRMLTNDYDLDSLVRNLNISDKFKVCLYGFIDLARKEFKNNQTSSLPDISVTVRIANNILQKAANIKEEIEEDPISFNYFKALSESSDMKYEIAKELRDYVK